MSLKDKNKSEKVRIFIANTKVAYVLRFRYVMLTTPTKQLDLYLESRWLMGVVEVKFRKPLFSQGFQRVLFLGPEVQFFWPVVLEPFET